MHTSCSVAQSVTGDIQVLPDNQSLNSTHFEGLESIIDTKTVFSCILTDFVEIFLDEALLLNKLDVC